MREYLFIGGTMDSQMVRLPKGQRKWHIETDSKFVAGTYSQTYIRHSLSLDMNTIYVYVIDNLNLVAALMRLHFKYRKLGP